MTHPWHCRHATPCSSSTSPTGDAEDIVNVRGIPTYMNLYRETHERA